MDKSAIEPRLPSPTPWTHLTSAVAGFFVERLIGRPKVGAVTITFPNGSTRTYGKPGTGFHPVLLVRNFSMVPETRDTSVSTLLTDSSRSPIRPTAPISSLIC